MSKAVRGLRGGDHVTHRQRRSLRSASRSLPSRPSRPSPNGSVAPWLTLSRHAICCPCAALPSAAATYVVDTLADTLMPVAADGQGADASAQCSLRAATDRQRDVAATRSPSRSPERSSWTRTAAADHARLPRRDNRARLHVGAGRVLHGVVGDGLHFDAGADDRRWRTQIAGFDGSGVFVACSGVRLRRNYLERFRRVADGNGVAGQSRNVVGLPGADGNVTRETS